VPGEPGADQRIVAGDQAGARLGRQVGQQVIGPVHGGQVGDDRERAVALHLLVEVHGVGGEHDRVCRRWHRDDHLAWSVAADLDELGTVVQRVLTLDEGEPPLRVRALEVGDLVSLGVRDELAAAGHRGGPEVVFGLADDDLSLRELMQVAGVVPVGVGDHDRVDGRRVDADRRQRVGWRGPPGAAAAVPGSGGEAGVDEGGSRAVANHPEVVVHLDLSVWLTVEVIVKEVLRAGGSPGAVADREHLAGVVFGHLSSNAFS
jgi:hypothetical protein